MAYPMVHLLAAWLWAQDKPDLRENPDYYLGTISPDAIHIRDGDDKSRKNYVHYNNWRTSDPDAVLAYWRERFTPFDIGYGIHALLDGQWVMDYRERFPQMLLTDGKLDRAIYYNDICSTDFRLFHESLQRPRLMELVRQGRAPEDHPMLTRQEFDAWREKTLTFYDRPCPVPGPARYLDMDYVQLFFNQCQHLMTLTYERRLLMNPVQQAILDRRSNRGFSDEALTEAALQTLADAALASPTAKNCQDWHFSFVTNRELLAAFSAAYRPLMPAGATDANTYDVLFHAPLCVFISLPEHPQSNFAQVDAGIAVENLALAAMGMGMGSVILGRPKEVFNADPEWEKRFGFPEGHHFAIAIAIGHPTATKEAHKIGGNKIHFVK